MYIYTWAVATRIAYTNIWLDTYKLKREEGVMFQVWKDSRKRGIIRQTLNGKPWRRKLICIAMRPINHLFISSCPFLLHKDHVRINGRPADNTCSSYVSMCMHGHGKTNGGFKADYGGSFRSWYSSSLYYSDGKYHSLRHSGVYVAEFYDLFSW